MVLHKLENTVEFIRNHRKEAINNSAVVCSWPLSPARTTLFKISPSQNRCSVRPGYSVPYFLHLADSTPLSASTANHRGFSSRGKWEKMQETEKYLTEKQVAEMINCGISTLRNWRHLGKGIPYIKFGRSVRYALSDVVGYMDERKVFVNTSGGYEVAA